MLFELFLILMTFGFAGNLEADHGHNLQLPGSELAQACPLIAIVLYVLVAVKRSKHQSRHWGGILAAVICILPVFWVQAMTHTFKIEHKLDIDVLREFERKFNTRALESSSSSTGWVIYVPRANYSPAMDEYLRAAKTAESK